jgi:hypothetical protein
MIGKSVTNIGILAFEDCGSPLTIDCLGNAPQADGTVFYGDDPVTIYYLPDTTGWDVPLPVLPRCCGPRRCHRCHR